MISATYIWARKLKKSKPKKKIVTLKKEAILRNFCSKYFSGSIRIRNWKISKKKIL